MPRTTTSLDVDWGQHLPGKDPYLVWASLSGLRNFDPAEGLFQVAVETIDNTDLSALYTNKNPADWPRYGLHRICPIGSSGGYLWTGNVTLEHLKTLVQRTDIKLEFSVARRATAPIAASSTAGASQSAVQPSMGKKVIAVVDFGCPFAHRQFLSAGPDGKRTTRVRYLWDQDAGNTARVSPPSPAATYDWWYPVPKFSYGRETTSPVLSSLFASISAGGLPLDEDAVYAQAKYRTMEERATHGAHVLDLAAGRINPVSGNTDAASEADIIFVQLPRNTVADTSGGSMTMYVLDALRYIFDKLDDNVEQLVINLSYGSTAGPHDGSTMLERGIDAILRQERAKRPAQKLDLVISAGNHFLKQLHGAVDMGLGTESRTLHWQLMADDYNDNYLEIWYPKVAAGKLTINLKSPNGNVVLTSPLNSIATKVNADKDVQAAIIHSGDTPNGAGVLALVALAPTHAHSGEGVEHGIWTVEITANGLAEKVTVHAWVERNDPMPWQGGQPQSHLLSNTLDRQLNSDDLVTDIVKRRTTGNSLGNGELPLIVGGYAPLAGEYPSPGGSRVELSPYTAAGPALNPARANWPDWIAPSDESVALPGILAAGTRSGVLVRMDGTSVAAPQFARLLFTSPPPAAVGAPFGDIRDQRGIAAKRA